MDKVTDLEVIRGEKKQPCLYCGEGPHTTPLACPRIAHVQIDPEEGTITGISFWDDFFDEIVCDEGA